MSGRGERCGGRAARAALLGLALAASVGGCAPGRAGAPEGPPPGEHEAVLALLRTQEAAWNRGDLEGFLEGYLDSAEARFFSGSSVQEGFEALRERYRARYAAPGQSMGQLRFEDLEAEVLGPTAAFARGKWRLALPGEERGGLFTLLLRKTGAGWRIVHDHTSS